MEQREQETKNIVDEPAPARAATTADRAMRDTAQKYLNSTGINFDLKDFEEKVRARALFSLGIAAGVGFFLGGGLATKLGVIVLGLFGRTAARQMATNVGSQFFQKAGARAS